MKNIAINVRGTNGAGKSYIVHTLKEKFGSTPLEVDGKIVAYRLHCEPRLYIVGRYETPTGGCDTIKTVGEAFNRVGALLKFGDVLFEGIMITSLTTRVIEFGRKHNLVLFVLDTPRDKCIARVESRRRARGNNEPLNPKNLDSKFRAALSSRKTFEAEGMDVRTLHYKKAVKTILRFRGYHAK